MNFGVVCMLSGIMICCSLWGKLKSFCTRMIFYVGCLGKSNVNRHWSLGTGKYSCDGIYCPCGVTWNSLCRSHGGLFYGICKDEIVIWIYCICIFLHGNDRRLIYCEVSVGMMICDDVQVCLEVVFCADSLLLCVHIHHTQNFLHLSPLTQIIMVAVLLVKLHLLASLLKWWMCMVRDSFSFCCISIKQMCGYWNYIFLIRIDLWYPSKIFLMW